ncbi:hypothetical protein SAMN04489844_0231 [Nocardioides exalbidus]|uniref:Uncharacterized protein n=1 Tax=Nocardioides exalbidus TaxID=402596 RepID=A0A1H4JPA4_9ACTN|nr:hypothetical protein [Nocardioides exalbidus]SEB47987.1 hypothetical protein SAMN04489844_0231 [Nocardioides exalbidus]
MTWTSHHQRGDVLREVIAAADTRLAAHPDTRRPALPTVPLPMDVAGVAETFGDETTLLGALQLRWHTRLAGRIERELADQPLDLAEAVTRAWRSAAAEMPGTRAVIDHHLAHPTSPEMARTSAIATAKEHELLALMAGHASAPGVAAQRAGREIEAAARSSYDAGDAAVDAAADHRGGSPSLVQRLKAVLAA